MSSVGLVAHHALGEQPGEGLGEVELAVVGHRPGEEAGIEQMQDRVLDAADILIDRQPVGAGFRGHRRAGARRAEAREIPRRIDEGIERRGLALRRAAAFGASGALPCRVAVERVARRLEVDVVRQLDRQIGARHRDDAALRAMHHRDRAAPVALARHPPVAQPVVDLAPSLALRLGAARHRLLGPFHRQPVEEVGVGENAVAEPGLVGDREARRVGVLRHHHGRHREAVLAGEFEVALVVRRAAEDGAGAVLHQDEIGDIDRQLDPGAERVAHSEPGIDAQLLGPFDRRLAGPGAAAILDEAGHLGISAGDLGGQRMFRRDRAEARPEQRVVPRGVDVEPAVEPDDGEGDAQPLGAADPVLLHRPHLVGPALQLAERRAQLLGVVGDAQEPLRHLALLDLGAGAPAAPVDHLLVGQHRAVDRVPVDPAAGAVQEPGFEEV